MSSSFFLPMSFECDHPEFEYYNSDIIPVRLLCYLEFSSYGKENNVNNNRNWFRPLYATGGWREEKH